MSLHLGQAHPLSEVAAGHCLGHRRPLVGGVACGACWEHAIRDDERVVVEHELPSQLKGDADLIDPVAIARAIAGQPVSLTSAERRLVNTRRRKVPMMAGAR